MKIYRNYIKRIFDVFFAVFSLFILLPIIIVIMLIYKINHMDIFFIQDRVGKDCKVFKIYKFKTLKDLNNDEKKLTDEERMTKIGRFLRKSSLDEIPQFINILKGEMSLIGPRPLLVSYLNKYENDEIKRHDVMPGITGLAQINGRNDIDFKKRFEYDLYYSRKISFYIDLKIFLLTIKKVIFADGMRFNDKNNFS